MKKSIVSRVQKQLIDSYPDLEIIRTRSETYSIIFNIVSIIGVLVFIIILLAGNFLTSFLSVFGIAFYFVILHYNTLPRLEYKKYFDSIKSKYIELILKQIDNSFEYCDGVIPAKDILDSELFGTQNITFQGQNYFKGNYKGIKVQVSEIDSIRSNYPSTSVLFIIEFKDTLKSKTFIYDRGLDNNETEIAPVLSPHGRNVKLENDVFEKTFRTTSLDKIEAYSVLTPEFVERILTLKDYLNNSKIYISFCNNKFSILIYNRSLFEPVLHESIKNNKTFLRFYREILYFLRIIDILNFK